MMSQPKADRLSVDDYSHQRQAVSILESLDHISCIGSRYPDFQLGSLKD
jgi:hypothetical protein